MKRFLLQKAKINKNVNSSPISKNPANYPQPSDLKWCLLFHEITAKRAGGRVGAGRRINDLC